MKRTLKFVFAGAAMLLVAVLAGFGTLRLFLHGREVTVPSLTGLSDADAALALKKIGLNLSVENRFYAATVTPNHVLSQSPAAGAHVRRGWQIRVTESLGGQKVTVPDLTGQTERPASLVLNRLQLELAPVAHLPAPAPTGVVLAQSPPAGAAGLNGPQVGLLVSEDEPADTAAYVMPSLSGLTLAAASTRLGSVGLKVGSATEPDLLPPPAPTPDPGTIPDAASAATAATAAAGTTPDPAIPANTPEPAGPPPISPNAVVTYQSPSPGRRVTRADTIRLTLTDASITPPPPVTPAVATPAPVTPPSN